jgi:hypothetical protein
MQDVIFMAVLVGFFILAGLFVVACDHLIGPDREALLEGVQGGAEADDEGERMAA